MSKKAKARKEAIKTTRRQRASLKEFLQLVWLLAKRDGFVRSRADYVHNAEMWSHSMLPPEYRKQMKAKPKLRLVV